MVASLPPRHGLQRQLRRAARLAELAACQDASGFVEPLFLATCIVASTDGPEEPAAVRARYAEAIRTLHEVAERLVPFATDDTDFIYRRVTYPFPVEPSPDIIDFYEWLLDEGATFVVPMFERCSQRGRRRRR